MQPGLLVSLSSKYPGRKMNKPKKKPASLQAPKSKLKVPDSDWEELPVFLGIESPAWEESEQLREKSAGLCLILVSIVVIE